MNNKASGIFFISWKYLMHWLASGRRNGRGIHSPFVYELARKVLYNQAGDQVPSQVLEFHRGLRKDQGMIEIYDLGAGSRHTSSSHRKISSIARHASVSPKLGALLYRLARWYKPSGMIEFGTGLGISTAYLAAGAGHAAFTSVEGSPSKYEFLRTHIELAGLQEVRLIQGDFKDQYESLVSTASNRMVIFIDGDHRYAPTLEKVNAILENEKIVDFILILDDIYWSKEMERCWNECRKDQRISISIDLFYFGILIKRKGIAKQHFMLKI